VSAPQEEEEEGEEEEERGEARRGRGFGCGELCGFLAFDLAQGDVDVCVNGWGL
jgi:hypothetical protein